MRALLVGVGLVLASATAHAGWNVDGVTVFGTNGVEVQGIRMQGIRMQGIRMQGIRMQGIRMQGIRMQGVSLDGVSMQSLRVEGTELAGSIIDAQPSTCSHSLLVTGAPLPASCNKCVEIVAARDPYCSQFGWDGTCVAEAQSWCSVTSADLVGAEFDAELSDGTKLILRLDAVRTVPDPTPTWFVRCDASGCRRINVSLNENADVKSYAFSIVGEVHCTYTWDCEEPYGCAYVFQGCARTPITPRPLCESTDADNLFNQALPVAGQWNDCVGLDGVNCGGKTRNTESTHFTLACRDVGVLAKCVERFNYKPWKDPFNPVEAPMHQTCVRMARADYCGNGAPHTVDGTAIDAYDMAGIQVEESIWKHEGLWGRHGAVCVTETRFAGPDPGSTYPSIGAYIEANCPAKFGIGVGGGDIPVQIHNWSERARCTSSTAPTLEDPSVPQAPFNWGAYIGNRASTLGSISPTSTCTVCR